MATKSFTSDFRLTAKAASNLIVALENSKRVDVKPRYEVKNVHKPEEIKNVTQRLLGKK
ncbi:MAG: hypothetical protein LBV67_11190 [Streptococcaceae bacterium]|jgi:hypothetical protein|nr:hypothetical protein [Streptococcaceae bacterium]